MGVTQQTMFACEGAPAPTITSDATSGYDATVGEIRGPAAEPGFITTCSAVAITRNSAVTARHCFPLHPDVAGWTFRLPQGEGYEADVTEIITHPHAWDIADHDCAYNSDGDPGGIIEGAIADVAIVWFGPVPIPPAVMAAPADVSFSSSPLLAVPPPAATVITGFGLSISAQPGPPLTYDGERRRGYVGGVELESDQSCLPGWGLQAEVCAYEDGVIGADGDSGGGLFIVSASDPSQAKLIGIKSGKESDPFGTWETWASTSIRRIYTEDLDECVLDCALDLNFSECECESTSNAALILQGFREDADGDGVVDEYDNCPPSWCVDFLGKAPEACANLAQTDSDGDGRGDACDPCPDDSLYGIDKFPFYDADGDGRPDACDNCPHYPTSGQLSDSDGDGVGNECDCPLAAGDLPRPGGHVRDRDPRHRDRRQQPPRRFRSLPPTRSRRARQPRRGVACAMKQAARSVALFALVIASAALLHGCTGTGCTEKGCGPAVTLTLLGAWTSFEPPRYEVELGFDGDSVSCAIDLGVPDPVACRDGAVEFWLMESSGGYELEISLLQATPASLSLAVRHEGTLVAEEQFEPRYSTGYPNGEECGPRCRFWRETVVLNLGAGPT